MPPPDHPNRRPVWLLLLALLVGAALVASGNEDHGKTKTVHVIRHASTFATKVDGPDKGTTPDTVVRAPAGAVLDAAPKLERDLRGSDKLNAQQRGFAKRDKVPASAGLGASDSVPGCVTRFVSNQSSRGGVAPRLFVLHETVSANRPGWGDVDAIVSLFNRPAFQASAHFVIDHEGHCAYVVPLARKAWHVIGFNSVAVGVEMIDTATRADGSYCGGSAKAAGCAKLASVWRTVHARFPGIAARAGGTSGCSVTLPGIVDHRSLGSCGGGHSNIGPWSTSANVALILKGSGGGSPAPAPAPSGCSVRAIQKALNAHGAKPRLVVDGAAGPKTRAAVVAFQRSHGLTADGVVGPRTGAKLGLKGC
jgi:hypothetical protein